MVLPFDIQSVLTRANAVYRLTFPSQKKKKTHDGFLAEAHFHFH